MESQGLYGHPNTVNLGYHCHDREEICCSFVTNFFEEGYKNSPCATSTTRQWNKSAVA